MTLLLMGGLAVALLMLVLWLLHFPLRNAAIVDVGWAGGLALIGAIDAILGQGWESRRVLVGAMPVIWGLRLATYLLKERIIGQPEEGRYQELRRKWRSGFAWKFLVFFEFQALLAVILSAPFWLAATNREPSLHWIEIAAISSTARKPAEIQTIHSGGGSSFVIEQLAPHFGFPRAPQCGLCPSRVRTRAQVVLSSYYQAQ